MKHGTTRPQHPITRSYVVREKRVTEFADLVYVAASRCLFRLDCVRTHLIRNFYRVVSTNLQTLHVIYAKGDATESSSLLGMWTPVMEQLMNLPPPQKGGAMVHKRTKQVHKFFKQVLPPQLANDPRLPYLNLVLSEPVQLAENELTKATAGQHKLMAKQAENVVYFLLQHAVGYEKKQGKHTVMFAEDVHLMDGSSLELLKRVAATIKPLLLVCSCRPPHKRPAAAVASVTEGPVNSTAGFSGRKSAMEELSSPEVSVSGGSGSGSGSVGGMVDGSWLEEKESALECVSDAEHETSAIHWKADPEEKVLDSSIDSRSDATPAATITPVPVHRSLSSSALDLQRGGPAVSLSGSSPSTLSNNPPAATTSTSTSAPPSSHALVVDDNSVWGQHYLAFIRLPHLSHIQLSGLNQTTCTRLVCQRLHANSLDPQLSTLIFRRSRGNPLYAVEVASHLMEKGYLTLSRTGQCMVNPSLRDVQGRPMTVDEASLDLPVSLKGLVTRRLDSLPVMDLLVCKLASAFGYEEFERAMLLELCRDEGVDERQVSLSIHGLQQANILAVKQDSEGRRGGSEEGGETTVSGGGTGDSETSDTLYFCHELVHSACYDLLVMSQKLRLHFKLASMELRRAKATPQHSQQPSDSLTAAVAALDDGQGAAVGSEPSSPAELDADGGGGSGSGSKVESGGGFAKRLAARLSRRRGDDSTDASATPTGTATTAAASAVAGNPSSTAVSGAELKRRASILTYHYTMSVRCYTPNAAGDSNEMRAFIREAKEYLSQRLVALPDDGTPRGGGSMQLGAEEALEAMKTMDSPALSPAAPPPPPPHSAWNDPPTTAVGSPASAPSSLASTAVSVPSMLGGAGSSRPPPAPPAASSGLFSGRRSWSGKQQTKPAAVPAALSSVPQSTPATNRQLFGRTPPPLPHSSSVVPAPYIRSHSTASLTSSPGLDSPARNFLSEPPPISHPILPPPAMSPTAQSPSHTTAPSPTGASPVQQLRSPHSSPPPLPFASPTAAGSESSIHVTVAQLYSALASVGLSAELKDRVVAQLMGTTRNNYLPAVGGVTAASATTPPTVIRAGSLPPPLTHSSLGKSSPPPLPLSMSHSFTSSPTPASASSATSTVLLALPRSASDVTTGSGLHAAAGEEPNSSNSVSQSSDFSFHRVMEADGDMDGQLAPDSPYTPPFRPPRFIPDQPHSPSSATDSQPSDYSASVSSGRGASAAPVVERPTSSPVAPAAATAAAGVVVSVGVAIDGLVKMYREDILSLRVLAKQAREPSAPIRRVVETTALLVSALQATSTQPAVKAVKPSNVPAAAVKSPPNSRTGDRGSKTPSWRELFASSSFINTLVKCAPLASPTKPGSQPAQPAQSQQLLSADASALRLAVNDSLMWKVAYMRSLSPALKAVWAWVLAVCAECGVAVERAAGGDSGGGAASAGNPSATTSSAMELSGSGGNSCTTGSGGLLGGTTELSSDDSDVVTIIGAEAVRARARSRSMEEAAPVSPSQGSPVPALPVSPSPSASPRTLGSSSHSTAGGSKRSTGALTPGRRSGKLSSTLSLQPASPGPSSAASSRSATTTKLPSADRDTPSPHSADVRGSVGSGGGGRSRAKRDALPSASTRSTGNVHLSVNAAIKVRRGKGAAAAAADN